MKKMCAVSGIIGLLIYSIYNAINRFIYIISDAAAYPVMIVSVILMAVGLAYNGYCLGKKQNPYRFK
jgi:hypothetical protein